MSITHRFIHTPLAMAVTLSTLAITGQAQAEETFALEEIIVTAQKRAESTQDIGASISAVTSESLDDFAAFDFSDVEKLTAGLSMDTSNPRAAVISLRGISYNQDATPNAAVDTYWNGLPVRADVTFGQLFDVERVELLRGPQGTLQGKTSPAGAVTFVTARPDLEQVEGYTQVSMNDNGGLNTQLAASLPIIPGQLAVRVAGVYDESDLADIENTTSGTQSTGNSSSGRITVSWEPSDVFAATLVHEYQEQDLDTPVDLIGSGANLFGQPGPTLSTFDHKATAELNDRYQKRNKVTMLEMNWEVMNHEITSVTGYQDNQSVAHTDLDKANYLPGMSLGQNITIDNNTLTQELRLSSIEPQFWEYIVGAYYENRKYATLVDRTLLPGALNQAAPGVDVRFISQPQDLPTEAEEFGFFSHNTFNLTDSTRAQVGLRYQKVRSYTAFAFSIPGFGVPLTEVLPEDLQANSVEAFTGTLKLMHDLNEETMIYASLDRSYRPPGAMTVPTLTQAEDLLYGDETSVSFEVGGKSMLWDNRLRLNAALYYQEFKGYISRAKNVLVDTDLNGSGDARSSGVTFNGDAIIQGAEVEFTALLSQAWTLGGGISYNDAKYDNADVPCDGAAGSYDGSSAIHTCSSSGRLAGEPNWSITLNTEYLVPLDGVDVFTRALYKYKGASPNENVVNGEVGGYGVADLFVGVRDQAQKWEASLWAKNITNKRAEISRFANAVVALNPAFPVTTGYREANVIQSRSVGVTAKYFF